MILIGNTMVNWGFKETISPSSILVRVSVRLELSAVDQYIFTTVLLADY